MKIKYKTKSSYSYPDKISELDIDDNEDTSVKNLVKIIYDKMEYDNRFNEYGYPIYNINILILEPFEIEVEIEQYQTISYYITRIKHNEEII